MRESLTVVGQVQIDPVRRVTANRGFNVLLSEYTDHFDRVEYVGPSEDEFDAIPSHIAPALSLSSCGEYGGSVAEKVKYLSSAPRVSERFRHLFEQRDPAVIQLRIPSLYTLLAHRPAVSTDAVITSYVAGDWKSAFVANYPFILAPAIGRCLDALQTPVIRNTIPVASGPAIAEQYRDLGPIHPFYATTHREVTRKDRIDHPPSRLIYVGRLSRLKRIQDAIDAVGYLVESGEDVRLSIVGEGQLGQELRRKVQRRGLEEHVTFHGYVDDWDRLQELYLASQILVFPSVSEGAVKVLAEAMAHGVVPVCVRGTGGNDYIIRHGENGMLVDARSPLGIASAVRSLRDLSAERFTGMVEACYAHAEKHTLPTEVERMWNFVEREAKRAGAQTR